MYIFIIVLFLFQIQHVRPDSLFLTHVMATIIMVMCAGAQSTWNGHVQTNVKQYVTMQTNVNKAEKLHIAKYLIRIIPRVV